jgi:tetratricopeptide (TPR) repeat protein
MLEMGDVDGARAETRLLAALAEELHQPIYRYQAARWEVVWAMIGDRLEELPALIARSHELGNLARAREADIEASGQQVGLAYRVGVLGNYALMLDAEYKANPQIVVNLPALALAHLQAGNREAAVAIFERIAEHDFAAVPRDMLWLGAFSVLSEVCYEIGDEPRARILYEALLPHRDRNVMVGMAACWGSAERFLGLLATVLRDFDAAGTHFETAIARNAEGGFDSMFEMVRRDYAAMLELRAGPGDAEHAARLRSETLATAEPPIAATQIEPMP